MQRLCTVNKVLVRTMAVFFLALAATTAFAQGAASNLPPGMVARQGGVNVTLGDIDAYAQKIPEKDRAAFFDSPKRIESVIMNLLLQKQMAAEARTEKLDSDPGVQVQVQQATDDTLARVAMEHYRKNLTLPDFTDLAQEYYLSHKSEFLVADKVDVEHVLVSNKDRSDAEAKARIGEVEAAARAHPDEFKALVEKYSDDPSKKDNHGLIADAASAKMVAPFATAAGALKNPGDISRIVKTEYGFHVLKLIGRTPGKQRAFEDVRPELIEKLRSQWIDKQITEHDGQMRGKPLEASPDLVASLRTRFLPADAVLPAAAAKAAPQDAGKPVDKDAKPAH